MIIAVFKPVNWGLTQHHSDNFPAVSLGHLSRERAYWLERYWIAGTNEDKRHQIWSQIIKVRRNAKSAFSALFKQSGPISWMLFGGHIKGKFMISKILEIVWVLKKSLKIIIKAVWMQSNDLSKNGNFEFWCFLKF